MAFNDPFFQWFVGLLLGVAVLLLAYIVYDTRRAVAYRLTKPNAGIKFLYRSRK
jgi:hypothetical protein